MGIVAQACNPRIWEAEVYGWLLGRGQWELYIEFQATLIYQEILDYRVRPCLNKCHLTPVRMTNIKETKDDKCWSNVEKD